ncbi:hypothetical protein C475_15633 [Halosimplex carlsbadense 2-9-1]|uniref:Antibiotic ABC transporter permease n=1 Tax=Halosimplex carlsbadense 2-9-1 TaxID=797114 RepID=M0CKE9_9EURY|nr:hypothetical protein [Halosimplex carlsbadense]ELZ23716.1 hypothetical protein C475_15633 [Halosimplex carlsbadense 2-9-1]
MSDRLDGSGEDQRPTGEANPVADVLRDTLAYARDRSYRGWDYGDGMSSRLLRAAPVDSKWLNIAVQELAKRPPVNIRPLLRVEQRRNYKGTALFAMANCNAAHLDLGGGDVDYAEEGHELAAWLVRNRSLGFSGFCGGHNHPIQHLDGRGHPNDPDVVSTSYAVKALLAAGELDPQFPAIAKTASAFVECDLDYRSVEGGAAIDYHLNHPDSSITINANALGARLLTDLHARFGRESDRRKAARILSYVADRQTDEGGWYYRDPPSDSHLSMDNHHNAFVLESFLRFREVVDTQRFDGTIDRALTFYRDVLFEESGAPNFDESNAYPRDVHAAANGVLVFTYAGDIEFAARIVDWTLDHLYCGDGRFYFRNHRFYTKRHVLMRWCVAWMAFALSEFLARLDDRADRTDRRLSGEE